MPLKSMILFKRKNIGRKKETKSNICDVCMLVNLLVGKREGEKECGEVRSGRREEKKVQAKRAHDESKKKGIDGTSTRQIQKKVFQSSKPEPMSRPYPCFLPRPPGFCEF
ncbi:hypothetical protein P171DRAFT_213683 [Karstenula rhodostoma CBS 690.94]|uniref:Uncharacterized protein n=1 Tax=Karstenula rhodostoma CBS 690.94 TaxID=1392251 RepID=A0A9P4UFG2_9PLEO|nr:hypothetical protein P171DRAFT_213683 [Karstenula rhodostoma CBS 690.94]